MKNTVYSKIWKIFVRAKLLKKLILLDLARSNEGLALLMLRLVVPDDPENAVQPKFSSVS